MSKRSITIAEVKIGEPYQNDRSDKETQDVAVVSAEHNKRAGCYYLEGRIERTETYIDGTTNIPPLRVSMLIGGIYRSVLLKRGRLNARTLAKLAAEMQGTRTVAGMIEDMTAERDARRAAGKGY